MKQNEAIVYNRAKTWQLLLWPANTTINNLMYVLIMFLSYIAVDGYGIAVVTAGLIATYTRIFDGITDPLVAMVTDRLETKHGKVRILLVIGLSLQVLTVLILFVWGIGRGIVFFTIVYMIYYIGATFASVTTNTGNAILTNDPKQRPILFRWGMVYTTVIASFTSMYLSKFLFSKYGGITTGALQELCFTVVGISLVLGLLAFIAIREKDTIENFPRKNDGSKINLKDAWQLLRKNKGLQTLIVAGTSEKLTQQASSQTAIMIMIYGILIGNYGFYGTFNMINIIPTLLAIFYATKMAGKNGTKKELIKWSVITIGITLSMILFFIVSDPTLISVSTVPTIIFIILSVGFTAATRASAVCTMALMPDVADYELYRSGNYMPGTVAAVYAFVDKTVSSFATTIVALGVASIGYVAVQPQPNDPVTTSLFWMALFLWMGLPAIGYTITLIMMKFYPLDGEMMHEIQQHNYELKLERKRLREAANK